MPGLLVPVEQKNGRQPAGWVGHRASANLQHPFSGAR
jgi:hypothetical protein